MHAGGTSGPLFGVWFRALARASDRRPAASTVASLAAGAERGLDAVARLGGARPGDKTMVDAMAPAARALAAAASAGAGLEATALVDACRGGPRPAVADATAAARSRGAARASYGGRRAASSRGVSDPGAEAVAMFFEAGERVVADGA